MDLYISALLNGTIGVDGSSITIAVLTDPAPQVAVEVLQVNGSVSDVATYSQLLGTVFTQILPPLLASMLSAIPLPAIDLSAMNVPGLPAGTSLYMVSPALDRPDDTSIRLYGDIGVSGY